MRNIKEWIDRLEEDDIKGKPILKENTMRDLESLSREDLQKYAVPTISNQGIEYVLGYGEKAFESVRRYMQTSIHMDFELMTAIAYSDVVSQSDLKEVISFLSANKNKYADEELLFLVLRSMVVRTWKLDVLLLTHLEQCALANNRWNQALIFLSQNKLEGNYFTLKGLPYWLRNTSINYAYILPDKLRDQYMQMEIVMTKSNNIQAKCKRLGETYIIVLDYGIYVYLQEWCRILLHGYRIRQYCEENDWDITDPVKTGAWLMISVVETLRGSGSVYQMPVPAMNFRNNDSVISREIVESQIEFMIGHELGHVVKHSLHSLPYDKSIEYEADAFSMEMLQYDVSAVTVINKADTSIRLPIEENDIQSKNPYDRKIEAVEILFAFYDIFYYTCRKRGYRNLENTAHPEPVERRKKIQNKYSEDFEGPLIKYADSLIERIKKQIDDISASQGRRETNESVLQNTV